jgi:thiol-disulfide isomerase/thioredoxin
MKNKFIPIILFIMAFTGFLSSQILWDDFNSSAKLIDEDKQKYSIFESNFQTLNLTTSKGTRIVLKEISHPIVILNFWASWCVPCLKEFPSLVEFQKKYSGKVKVIGINGDTENVKENILKTEGRYKLNFESAEDANESISGKYLVKTYPVSIIYHRGKVIYVSKKVHNFMDSEFLELIDKTLKAN